MGTGLGFTLMDKPTRVLIAAPAVVIRQLRAALPADADVTGAAIWVDAVRGLAEVTPQLIIVCYVFDEVRPYRFIQHVRDTEDQRVPIFLIRAVTIPLGATQEADLRRSYVELGVNAFLNFSDLANERGLDAALEEFRRVALSLLPYAGERSA
jgi:PleD family two-component response regulator